MTTRSRLATERMHVSVVRADKRPKPQSVRFRALEGPVVVVIEADSEDDALAICAETGLDYIGLCDD